VIQKVILPPEVELFASLRDGDVVTPLHENVQPTFDSLSTVELSNPLPQTQIGLNYLDNVFPYRFDARTTGLPSLREALADDTFLRKTVQYIASSGREPTRQLVLRNLQFACRAPSHFFPSAAAVVFRAFGAGRDVFDPFAGWGGRALGAVCAGVRSLVTTDLQPKSIVGCQRIAQDFASISPSKIEAICSDFKSYMSSTDRFFDLIFTSPPFFSTEDYGHKVVDTREWLDSVLVPFAKMSLKLLKPNGRVAIHAQNRKDMPMLSIVSAVFTSAGFSLENEWKYGKKPGQSVLVFK